MAGGRLPAILALAVFLAAPLAVPAQESLYVKADGSDEHDGLSEATAYKTLLQAFARAMTEGPKKITVIGTLNRASGNEDETDIFSLVALDGDPILITGIPNAPAGRRAVLSGEGTKKSVVYSVFGSFRFEHIEISGSVKTGLRVGIGSSVTLGPGSLVRNNADSGVFVVRSNDESVMRSGALILDGGIVENNRSSLVGGGIFVGGSFTMKRGSVRNNTAVADEDGVSSGGGIYATTNATVSIEGREISGNTAVMGGGIGIGTGSRVTMTGGSVANNSATAGGGGVLVLAGAAFVQTGGGISGNRAPRYPNVHGQDGSKVSLLPAPSTPRPSSGSTGSGGSLAAADDTPVSRPASAPAKRSWFYDSDAGVYFAGFLGYDLRGLNASPLAAGIPLQLGVGFNFARMRLAILGEGQAGLGGGIQDDDLYFFFEMSAGGAAEFYFPGRFIGLTAGWSIFLDKNLGDIPISGRDDTKTSFQRLGLIFQGPGALKTTLYGQRFNDDSWGFGVMIGGAWGLER